MHNTSSVMSILCLIFGGFSVAYSHFMNHEECRCDV
jgi:hypothetical protein